MPSVPSLPSTLYLAKTRLPTDSPTGSGNRTHHSTFDETTLDTLINTQLLSRVLSSEELSPVESSLSWDFDDIVATAAAPSATDCTETAAVNLKSCLRRDPPSKAAKRKSKAKRVKFTTATTFEFPRSLGGCTVSEKADAPALGMTMVHTHVHTARVASREARAPLAPLDLLTRFELLWASGASASAMDDDWAEIDGLHRGRERSQRDFPDEDITERLRRLSAKREHYRKHVTRPTWFQRLRCKLHKAIHRS
ncbi:hypothetical protein ACHHYP_05822 [Achlya hypogyna]|uniref:Uncharacterized protein n=1 Tax=Achlya hypogyna TaxID=1202772 RepID=A0A1V9YW73_ACHHY|nr:hypothetical protein ACHHYP_05822 [Achlya hypogyna]